MKLKYVLALLIGLLFASCASKYTAPTTKTFKSYRGYIDLKPVENKISANGKEYYLFLAHTKEDKPVRFILEDASIINKIMNHHKDSLVVLEGTPSLPFSDKTKKKIQAQIMEKFGNDGIVVAWVYNHGMEHKCGEVPCENPIEYNNPSYSQPGGNQSGTIPPPK